MTKRHPLLVPVVLTHAAAMVAWSVLRHAHHGSSAYDLGAYHEVFYNLAFHGSLWSPIEHFHQWSAHFEVGLVWLAAFYRAWPSPFWLFALQNVTCALAAVPVEAVARKASGDPSFAFATALAMLLAPQLVFAEAYDFHSITVCVLPMAVLAWALFEDRPFAVFASALVLLSLREQMGLALVTAGAAWLVLRGRARLREAVSLAALGAATFAAEVFVVLPWFGGGQSFRYLAHYRTLGGSPGSALAFAVGHPWSFVTLPFRGGRVAYLAGLASGALLGLLLAVRARRSALWPLLLALPLLAIQLYSDDGTTWHIRFQYGAPLVPLVAMTMALGFASLQNRRAARWLAWGSVGATAIHAAIIVGPELARPGGPLDFAFSSSPRAHALARAIDAVPTGAFASAEDSVTPHLTGAVHLWPDGESTDDFVLLDVGGRAPNVAPGAVASAEERLRADPAFIVRVDDAGVLLVERRERVERER